MDRLQEANRKLDEALRRLEEAVARSDGGGDKALQKALAETKAEHKALRGAAEEVTQRLDDTVARLQKLLKE